MFVMLYLCKFLHLSLLHGVLEQKMLSQFLTLGKDKVDHDNFWDNMQTPMLDSIFHQTNAKIKHDLNQVRIFTFLTFLYPSGKSDSASCLK